MLWVELWLRAVREPGSCARWPPTSTSRYREWIARLIRAGRRSGEFRADVDVDALADLAMALLDGLGVRALMRDPAMDVDVARGPWSPERSLPSSASTRRRCWAAAERSVRGALRQPPGRVVGANTFATMDS